MKKYLFIFITLFFTQGLFSQNNDIFQVQKSAEELKADLSKVIIHQNGFMNLINYETIEGEKIPEKNLKLLLDSIPENKKLRNQETFWNVMDYVCLGLAASGIVTYSICAFNPEMQNKETYQNISITTTVISLFGAIFSGNMATSKRLKAVDNYNISVMGIPIQ